MAYRSRTATLTAFTATLTVAALGLGACSSGGSDESSSGPTTITYWHRLPDKDGMIKVAQAAAEWNKKHPDIHVNTVKFDGTADASYDKISAAVKAGNAPCLAQASYDGIPAMLVRGELKDVTDIAKKYRDHYAEAPYGQVTLGGKTYGLPQDTGPLVYYYDKDAFDKLGLKPPKTWDEYWSNARKAHQAGKYTSIFFKDEAGDWYAAINAAHGQQWFDVDGQKWKVNVDSTDSQKVAENWQKSIDDGSTLFTDRWGDPSPRDLALKDGKLIGYASGAWATAFDLDPLGVKKANWRVAQMPGDQTGAWGGSALVVLKDCKEPEKALEFADWYNTNLKAMASQGLVPAAKGDVDVPDSVKDLFGGQDVMAELRKATDHTNPDWKFSPTWPTVKKTIIDNAGNNVPLPQSIADAQKQAVSSLKGKGLEVEE